MKKINMAGARVGKLEVISENGRVRQEIGWLCRCDCGKEVTLPGYRLRDGSYVSCGRCTTIGDRVKKHGMYNTRLYHCWENMRSRCNNPGATQFKDYGGRGISVCGEWDDFDCYKNWALANGYSDELTIERINNNGDYEPENCKWETVKNQAKNKRSSTIITFQGKTQTLKDWSIELNISYKKLRNRFHSGVPVNEIFSK